MANFTHNSITRETDLIFCAYPVTADLKFQKHPMNVSTQPGLQVEFSVETSKAVKAYNWYFQEKPLSSEETDYIGTTSGNLTIAKCLPKHKGAYKCVVTDEFDETYSSEAASLTIGELW